MLTIASQYKQRPSEVIGLTNDYEAFCFDEACVYIFSELNKENAKEPDWVEEDKKKTPNASTIEWMMKHSKPL